MENLVTNRIRFAIKDDVEGALRRIIPLLTTSDPDEILMSVAAKLTSEVTFDPLIVTPMPYQLKIIPTELPEKIDLAIAACTKFDFVLHRYLAWDPAGLSLPYSMWPRNRRQVIEENGHALKSLSELQTWAEREIPDAVRVAHLMKLALRDTGFMDPITWVS